MNMNKLEMVFRTKKREYLIVLLFFLIMAILFTWPLILHIHNGVIGGHGDPMLNNWIISWEAKTIFTNPTNLFQGNIIYPARDVLAYSEHLFTLGLLGAPIYHLTGNPILTYNLLIFFAIVFSAFGCYLLIKELTGSRWGGLFGGLFFALCPYRIAKADHIQILFSAFSSCCSPWSHGITLSSAPSRLDSSCCGRPFSPEKRRNGRGWVPPW
jgi:hypothetical protein